MNMKTKPTLREVRLALQSKASLLEKFYSSGADDYFAEILRRALELLPKRDPKRVPFTNTPSDIPSSFGAMSEAKRRKREPVCTCDSGDTLPDGSCNYCGMTSKRRKRK